MPEPIQADEKVPFSLPTSLPAMQKLKFRYGGNEFDMEKNRSEYYQGVK